MNFHFQHKEFVWLFLAIAILFFLFIRILRWKKRVIKRIGDEKLVGTLIGNYSSRLFALRFILVSIAIFLGIVALMNPRVPGGNDNIKRKGIDVAIALDVSKSMLAADFVPNRLERAKQFIGKLINEMPNDRIALVLFAGKAYLQMPLTVDHGAASLFVASASPDAIPQQGTVLGDALNMSANVFSSTDKRFKSVVLISDGEDHDEEAVTTAKELANRGVMINTVGVGSPQGSFIIDPLTGQNKIDASGNTIITKLNEETLKDVAQKTNGIYIRLQSSDDAISALKNQFSQIDRKAFNDESMLNFRTYYLWFAAAMFFLLLIEIFISERRKHVA
jgi:Ca-activated chloride channel family protein